MKMLKSILIGLVVTLIAVSQSVSQEKQRVPDSVLNRLLKGMGDGPHGFSEFGSYYFRMRTEPEILSPGLVTLIFVYSPKTACNNFKISISEIENLKVLGDLELTSSATKGDTVTLSVTVDIPPNDTSGFKYELDYCGEKQVWYNYFTASESAVRSTSQNLSRAARTRHQK